MTQQWQLWTREDCVYPAVIIDLFSRRVIGRAISSRMTRDLAIRVLSRMLDCGSYLDLLLKQPPAG